MSYECDKSLNSYEVMKVMNCQLSIINYQLKKVFIIVVLLFFVGCSRTLTKVVEVPKIKTEYREKYLRDNVYFYDSIFVSKTNDTLFINKFHYKYIDRIVKDTISRTDTITLVKTVEVPIRTNKLTTFQKFSVRGFWVLVGLIIIGIFVKLKFG